MCHVPWYSSYVMLFVRVCPGDIHTYICVCVCVCVCGVHVRTCLCGQ
jgi:hypothetical protein